MSWRFSLTLGLYLLFLTFVSSPPEARAQTGPDIFVTPIPNSPFTGEIEVERSIVRPDGVVVNMRTARKIGRDNRGRIFNEARTLVPASGGQFPQVETIRLYDPETRISTMLNVHGRTFWTMIVRRPPATMPPALVEATPAGDTLQQNAFTAKEDLGIREIGGVPAHGVRETQKIPVDGKASGQQISVIDEYWYSDDLRINLMIKHSDPRTGSVKMTVGEIQRAEPDPALFEVPAGYKRVENR
jgi:hypothetical protein